MSGTDQASCSTMLLQAELALEFYWTTIQRFESVLFLDLPIGYKVLDQILLIENKELTL